MKSGIAMGALLALAGLVGCGDGGASGTLRLTLNGEEASRAWNELQSDGHDDVAQLVPQFGLLLQLGLIAAQLLSKLQLPQSPSSSP